MKFLDLAESKVFEIAEKRTGQSEGPQSVTNVLQNGERLDALVKSNKEVTGVTTGFTDLDKNQWFTAIGFGHCCRKAVDGKDRERV